MVFFTKEQKNLILAAHVSRLAQEGLLPFIKREIESFHKKLKEKTTSMSTSKMERTVLDEIHKSSKKGAYSWSAAVTNMNLNNWKNDPWELAKCFLPKTPYNRASDITTTNLRGFFNIIINWTHFYSHLIPYQRRVVTEVTTHALLKSVFILII